MSIKQDVREVRGLEWGHAMAWGGLGSPGGGVTPAA
jgi:hypothetical protein